VHKSFLKTSIASAVWLRGQSDKAFLEYVSLKGVKTSDHDVNPEIVLVAPQEVRLGEVLGDQVAVLLSDMVLFADYLDPFSATHVRWL